MAAKRQTVVSEGLYLTEVQSFASDHPIDDVLEYYKKHQVVLIKGAVKDHDFGIKNIKGVYTGDLDMLNETFSMETKKGEKGWGSHSSSDLFGDDSVISGQWYASFIAQMKATAQTGDSATNSTYISFKNSLPLSTLPLEGANLKVKYTAPIWVFVGQNDQESTFLHGRPEHIDSVNHDGTWHLQSSGTKVWYIRPADTKEWGSVPVLVKAPETQAAKKRKGTVAESGESFNDGLGRLKVVAEEGDILIINTRVWWHQTRIPFTGPAGYSISYAIDFFCKALRLTGEKELDQSKRTSNSAESESGSESGSESEGEEEEVQEYSNIDGIYSSRALKSGDVVFYESELPDCALPRSDDPNCEIVWLEDGTGALFALKDLAVGDWLTVCPSEDEDSDDEDEEEDEDGEGEDGSEEEGSDEEECCEAGSDDDDEGEEDESGEDEN